MPAQTLPKTRLLALTLAGLAAATPVLAHHPMGGMTPATFTQGLLSGLGHPVIGLDHLAALVGVGLVSSRFVRGLTLPAFWIVAMAAGVAFHLASASLPYAEALVALSVMAIGLAASVRTTLPYALIAALFAAGGAVHGYALGEAIIGAEATPLAAYLAGLVAVQVALTTGIAFAARYVAKGSPAVPSLHLRLAGLAVTATGAATLVLSLPAFA
jgi:urease accessory protein